MIKKILILSLFALTIYAQELHLKGTVKIDNLEATVITTDTTGLLAANFFTGTDSIHYGKDSIVVAHGVGSTPSFISIQLVSDGFGFQTWVSGINSLAFYVRRSDTGLKTITSSIQFKWMAYK